MAARPLHRSRMPASRGVRRRRGVSLLGALVFALAIAALVILVIRLSSHRATRIRSTTTTSPGRVVPSTDLDPRGVPMMSHKPVPVVPGFGGCPPEGDGGDPALNRLKNRIDSAAWIPVSLERLIALPWPSNVVRHRQRSEWRWLDATAVARYEGMPFVVEGYVAGASQSGPESTNCHGADASFRDWHIWLATSPGRDRRRALVAEATPVVRAAHPRWSLSAIRRLGRDSTLVRVSGWLMLDPEHPEQLRKTRGTIWELHPILRIEARARDAWVDLQELRR